MRASRDLGDAAQRNRMALYLGDGRKTMSSAELRPYFEDARMHGLRIVTVKRETRAGVAGVRPVLKRLVARMEAGEFEAIVTIVAADVALSTLPPPTVHGDTWITHPGRAR